MKDIFPFKKKVIQKEKDNVHHDKYLFEKKLNPNYVKKLTLILHDSINYKDYANTRKNLRNAIYKDIGDNKLRLTFKKFPIKLVKQNNISSYNNSSNLLQITPKKSNLTKSLDEIREKKSNKNFKYNPNKYKTIMIDNDIKKILYNNEEKIPLIQQKKIYNKFKHKFLYYKPKLIEQLKSPFFTPIEQVKPIKNDFNTIPINNSTINKNQTQSLSSNYTIDMNNLFQTCNTLKVLRDKNVLNEKVLNNQQILYEKIKEELVPSTDKIIKKKNLMSRYDFFYYDAKKWNIMSDEMLMKNKEKEFYNNINRKINISIKHLKNKSNFYSNKLCMLNNIKNSKSKSLNEINPDFDFD